MVSVALAKAAFRPDGRGLRSNTSSDFGNSRFVRDYNGPDIYTQVNRSLNPTSGESSLGFKPVYKPGENWQTMRDSIFKVPLSGYNTPSDFSGYSHHNTGIQSDEHFKEIDNWTRGLPSPSALSGNDYHMRPVYRPDGLSLNRTDYDRRFPGDAKFRNPAGPRDNTISGNIERIVTNEQTVPHKLLSNPPTVDPTNRDPQPLPVAGRSVSNRDNLSLRPEAQRSFMRTETRLRPQNSLSSSLSSVAKTAGKPLAAGLGIAAAAHVTSSAIQTGGSLIGQKMAQDYRTSNINRATDYMTSHGIPWIPGGSASSMPSTNQHLSGHTYVHGPGGVNPYSYTNVGLSSAFGVGNIAAM